MHLTAMSNCRRFFECYGRHFVAGAGVRVLEIGSQDVNGSLRETAPVDFEYVGLDFAPAKGVDVVLEDPYRLPFAAESADIVLSSSCFEHSEMFWIVFLEVMRVLKPRGLFYLNVPSNGAFHRFPVDCWRFYPDSGHALVTWARRNGVSALLLESYTSGQSGGQDWNDFVAVFLKDASYRAEFQERIVDTLKDFTNGFVADSATLINHRRLSEDQVRLALMSRLADKRASAL
jgi:SAM-dependent methyltransferase